MRTTGRNTRVRDNGVIEELRRELLEGPGVTERPLRAAVLEGGDVPEAIATYASKVRERSYEVSDADVDALRTAGYDEDAIFELTVLAATGAATAIMGGTLRAIGED